MTTVSPALAMTVDLTTDLPTTNSNVRDALSTEGFGVLTEIDVQQTLKSKLDIDTSGYLILGACNPTLAHRAISADPTVGLLLPCNVVIREIDTGTRVEFADPERMLELIDNEVLREVAAEARQRLAKVAAVVAGVTDVGLEPA
jgi:uncharacterized protein (DUF302 family)